MAIALAQAWVKNRQAGGTTNTATITTTAGSLIVVIIHNEFTSVNDTTFTVTDSNSATYTQAEKEGTGQFQSWIYYRENAAAVTSVSVTDANSGTYTIEVGEFTGVATSSSLDAHGNNAGSSTTPTVPATTITTTDTDLIVAGYTGNQTQASITDPGSGWTATAHGAGGQDWGGAYRISAASTYSAQWTVGTGTGWHTVIASWKPAAGGGAAQPIASSLALMGLQ